MKLIIVPPEVDSTDDIRKISDGESFIFTADHLLKKELVRGKIARPDKVLTISDVADDSVFDDVNDLTRRYSREWFKAEEADEILSFRGVNLAGQLVAETSFYFIKVLRAVCISQAIRGSYGGKAEFILADDESIWAKVFKYTARKRGIGLDIRKFAPAKGSLDSGIFPIKDMIRRSAARLYGRTRRNIPSGGILYSCAPGYFKLFRDISATGGTSYYLRPEFSPRTGIEFRGKETVYLTPECFIEKEDKTICRKWLKNRDIRAVLDSHFKDSDFFVYKGDNLWEIIKHDLFHMLDQALFRGAVWVLGFNRILDSLKPRTIIVEENICPFNKTLIECADKKGIPSVYLLHGLLTYDLFSSIGSASTVVVPGTYTKKFLTDHGVAENMIAEIGLPYYEKKISSIDRTGSRRKFFSRYGLDDGKRIVMLASHDVFTEKRPYYTG
ncbi:MAG: hypothetical protein KKG84_01095, partial [Candidatus Omnitrophica bacterium]|nr:hypothetical protein [Candidatus Omnitrophota bacterium]